MNTRNVSEEYAKALSKYLHKFGLEPIDIAFLVGTRKDIIDGLVNARSGVVLKTLEKIAQVFGLKYYELGNPDHPLPPFDTLPQSTKKRIAYRKELGPHKDETYNSLNINEKIAVTLSAFEGDDEFLIEELVDKINAEYGDSTITSLIGDRLSKAFGEYVKKTNRKGKSKSGRGRRPYYFRLIKVVPKEVVSQAKDAINDKWKEEKKKK